MAKQKIVIRVAMPCERCRSKAMSLVAATCGVDSVALAGDAMDKVVVVGDGVDSVKLTSALRRKVGAAQLVQVGEVKKEEEKKKKPAEEGAVVQCANPFYHYYNSCPPPAVYYVPVPRRRPSTTYQYPAAGRPDTYCSIM